MTASEIQRSTSYGQAYRLTMVDRFGVWLSGRSIRKSVGGFEGLRVGDFGCGYQASFSRSLLPVVDSLVLADVALAPDLVNHPKVRAVSGIIPDILTDLPSDSLDVVLCISALEHFREPARALETFHRLLAPGGVCLINVPNWRGKRFLELAAFRLGLGPADEMDDHQNYYDPKDLWPLLRRAGFLPHNIRCHRHKFGLNTFALCRATEVEL